MIKRETDIEKKNPWWKKMYPQAYTLKTGPKDNNIFHGRLWTRRSRIIATKVVVVQQHW